jgi:hypothetical protein
MLAEISAHGRDGARTALSGLVAVCSALRVIGGCIIRIAVVNGAVGLVERMGDRLVSQRRACGESEGSPCANPVDSSAGGSLALRSGGKGGELGINVQPGGGGSGRIEDFLTKP